MAVEGNPPAQGGGEEAVAAVGNGLAALAEADPAFRPVLDAFAAAVEKIQGGGAEQAAAPVSPEQGGSGAVPANMGRPR